MSESGKAAGPAEVHDPGLRAGGARRKSKANAGTEFRGVSCRRDGKFGARIRDYEGGSQTWLGTFDTAEDAARAYDAAAARMHGAAARTNFKQQPAATGDGGASSLLHAPAEPSGHDARTKFRGVCRQSSGRFGARISKQKAGTWLGTFDTAEEAARAYDAAAVKVLGARAKTNFKQPAPAAAVDDDRHPSGGEYICRWKGKAAMSMSMSLGGFEDSLGMCHGDLSVDLPPAEWQQVDDLLKNMDSTDDRETLIKAAAILQHISLAGQGDDGSEPRQKDDVDDEHYELVG